MPYLAHILYHATALTWPPEVGPKSPIFQKIDVGENNTTITTNRKHDNYRLPVLNRDRLLRFHKCIGFPRQYL